MQTERASSHPLDRSDRIKLALILSLATIVRLFRLGKYSLWNDEVDTIFAGMNQTLYHPPLFNELAYWWFGLVRTEFLLRLLPAVIGILAVFTIWVLSRSLFETQTAHISALLLSLSPPAVYYSREYRMYIFFLLLCLLSWMYLFRTLETGGKKNLLFFSLTAAANLYTHNFATFVLAGQLCAVFFFRPLKTSFKRLLSASLLIGLLYIPWMIRMKYLLSHFTHSRYWAPPISLKTIPYFARFIVSNFEPPLLHAWILSLMTGFFLLWGLSGGPEHRRKASSILFVCGILVPVFFIGLTAKLLPTTLFVARYAIFILAPLLILTAAGLARIRKTGFKFITLTVFCSFQASCLFYQYENIAAGPLPLESRPKKEFREAAKYIAAHYRDGDCAAATCASGSMPLSYYLTYRYSVPMSIRTLDIDHRYWNDLNKKTNLMEIIKEKYPFAYPIDINTPNIFDGCRRLWFFGTQWNPRESYDDFFYAQRMMIRDWLDKHYTLLDAKQYKGVDLRLYDLSRPQNRSSKTVPDGVQPLPGAGDHLEEGQQ